MEKGKKGNILFGIFMVIMLIAPFIIFGQMADRKQAQSTRHNTTVSSEVKGEEAVEKSADRKMQFTWKTVFDPECRSIGCGLKIQKNEADAEKKIGCQRKIDNRVGKRAVKIHSPFL